LKFFFFYTARFMPEHCQRLKEGMVPTNDDEDELP